MTKAKRKTGKISRRQMVMLLGSGVVFAGTVRAEDVAAPTPAASCVDVTPTIGKGADGRLLLIADTCCLDGFDIFEGGFKGHLAGTAPRTRLKAFEAALAKAKKDDVLMEYCVMMWGLTQKQSIEIKDDLKTKYFPKGK